MSKITSFPLLGIAFAIIFSINSPLVAQEIQFGDGNSIDLDEDETELKPRISTDGDRINIQVEEQPKPETKIKFGEDGIEISEEEESAQERLNLSIPTREKQ